MSKPKVESGNPGKGLPKDICCNCYRNFAWVESKEGWCFWCLNPQPSTRVPMCVKDKSTTSKPLKTKVKKGSAK